MMGFTVRYATFAIVERPGSLLYPKWAAWIAGWSWLLHVGILATWLILLFPDGRLPSPRWRAVGWLAGVSLTVGTLTNMLVPGQITGFDFPLENPAGLEPASTVLEAVDAGAMIAIAAIASTASLVVRFRRSRGIERQQLKWVMYAGAIAAMMLTACIVGYQISDEAGDLFISFTGLSLWFLPIAAGIAILRYWLYDIDRIINRTLVYGTLSATLLATYAGSVLLLQWMLQPFTRSSDLTIAASTLAAAAMFSPARRHIQSVVDRRFYRSKYDATRTLDAFSARSRDEVDLDALARNLQEVVQETMQPAHISI